MQEGHLWEDSKLYWGWTGNWQRSWTFLLVKMFLSGKGVPNPWINSTFLFLHVTFLFAFVSFWFAFVSRRGKEKVGALIHFSVALVEVIRFLSAKNMYQTQSSTISLITYLKFRIFIKLIWLKIILRKIILLVSMLRPQQILKVQFKESCSEIKSTF